MANLENKSMSPSISGVSCHPSTPKTRNESRPLLNLAILASLALVGAMSVVLFFRGSPFRHISSSVYEDPVNFDRGPDNYDPAYVEPPFHPMKRYSLDYHNVACWQNEGVWIRYLNPLDMKSLGINRFQDTDRSLNQTEEDAFCAILRTYGAQFYSLPPRWPFPISWSESIDGTVKPAVQINMTMCFPETGGVWLLDLNKDGYTDMGLRNAVTIEERCEIFEKMGAKFCDGMRDPSCPETAILVDKIEYEDREGAYGDERSYFLPGGEVIGGWGEEDNIVY